MSDKMTPIPFSNLMEWVLEEHKKGTVFGIQRPFVADQDHVYEIFGRKLETPFGPAAGPHTQLAQNIMAAYYAGSRFFELKTVQVIDGEDLPVSKPCIKADDECYNVEWSTELYVPQAFNEYVKAWFACQVMAKEFGLGAMDGFQFNMSVGYDLAGIQTEKVDSFIEGMKDASGTAVFKECRQWLLDNLDRFEKLTRVDVESISPAVCNSITLSTLHGCPPAEIERIATYLLTEKKTNTFIKCNPTLLGYEYARKLMDDMGYDYVAFGDFHFKDDLQYEDTVPMLTRLQALADEKKLQFGVKITNTFPVDIKAGELPGNEMYMSGKSLYALSMSVAEKLSRDFGGKLRISYSGGADAFNIEDIVEAGIWPVTMATTMLKPGGYQRLEQIGKLFAAKEAAEFTGVDAARVAELVEEVKSNKYHVKAVKPLPNRKMKKEVPLVDCFVAPCKEGCPIHQDITVYIKLVGEGKYEEALKVITEKNPLPFITGTICAHNCMSKCTRNFYEDPVNIRGSKLTAAEGGYEALMAAITAGQAAPKNGKKAAVVGGGPAGLSAAYFLAKAGYQVTLLEKDEKLGGVVRNIIPGFRIEESAIEKDVALVKAMGVEMITGSEIQDIKALKAVYDAVVLAVGAGVPGSLRLEEGQTMNALEFLRSFKETDGKVALGKNVVVIGGGNTAMDTARAAKRNAGVEKVSLVYRRTKRYMPADAEELEMVIEDGVEFAELLAPVKLADGVLTCRKMVLGDYDASGRRGVVETDEIVTVAADTVIAAVGEKVPSGFYQANGLAVDERGRLVVNPETMETSVDGIFAAGDGVKGPATVVEGIRDGRMAAEGIAKKSLACDFAEDADAAVIYEKKGRLLKESDQPESSRCLTCSAVCENCVEVCPNRANVSIKVPGRAMHQIIHVDYMCNECGNCKSFCPYSSAPYLDKFTLFANEADMENSKNQGFTVLDGKTGACKVRLFGRVLDYTVGTENDAVAEGLRGIIDTVVKEYAYLLMK
ncbi:MAG: putative selenate reductase subunit YgfK [Lachnospiraceae bacterium]|nr:putative selenate reductase subunit YgfK [Lachnospiraceae bacterium]